MGLLLGWLVLQCIDATTRSHICLGAHRTRHHLIHIESYIMMLFMKESPDLGMEDDACCHVGLGAGEGDAVAQLHPGRGQDGPGVRRRQPKHILLTIVQQLQHNCNINRPQVQSLVPEIPFEEIGKFKVDECICTYA